MCLVSGSDVDAVAKEGGDPPAIVQEAWAVIVTLAKHKPAPPSHHPRRELWKNLPFEKKYVSKRILKIQKCTGFLISILLFSIYIWIANRTRWHEIFGASSPAVLTQPALYRSTRPQFFLLKQCIPASNLKQSHPQPTRQRAAGHADFLWHDPPSRGWPWYFHGPSAVESAGSWWREKRKVHGDFPCCPEQEGSELILCREKGRWGQDLWAPSSHCTSEGTEIQGRTQIACGQSQNSIQQSLSDPGHLRRNLPYEP